MGSIVDKLSKLIDTKTAIKEAITAKGVTVEDSDPFLVMQKNSTG